MKEVKGYLSPDVIGMQGPMFKKKEIMEGLVFPEPGTGPRQSLLRLLAANIAKDSELINSITMWWW